LLETSIEGARGILLNVSGGKDLTLHEITEVAEAVAAAAEPDATLIFGAVVDESLNDSVCVTLVAAGFDSTNDDVLAAQVEGGLRPVRPAERKSTERTSESRSTDSRLSGTRSIETRFIESRFEPRSTQRKSSAQDFDSTDWDKPSREPRSTPRRKGDDDDLDVPSFLR
jgi:hypothetical protein